MRDHYTAGPLDCHREHCAKIAKSRPCLRNYGQPLGHPAFCLDGVGHRYYAGGWKVSEQQRLGEPMQGLAYMVTESPNDLAIVSGIIVLAHGLNLDVVAEGVETAEQHKFLRLLRCDQMQGYLFSKPIAKAMIEQILKSGANIAAQAHVASDSQSNRTVSEPEFCERRLAAQETWKPA
jgi:hypothetical protein